MSYNIVDKKGISSSTSIKTIPIAATGGIISTSGLYTIHKFNSSGTFTPNGAVNVEYLIVGGGGGGGSAIAGGGGAGGLLSGSVSVSGATTVTVGGGGGGGVGSSINGTNGSNSVFGSLTATGGGGGGSLTNAGGNGGSGGGSRSATNGTGTSGQGNNGGNIGTGSNGTAGGGGGAGAVGSNAASSTSGAGGNGTSSSITGTAVTYAGGGGGGAYLQGPTTGGAGGSGGGGAGNISADGAAGTDNLGGGGGGGGYSNAPVNYSGGNGGSGIVIVRYLTSAFTINTPIYASNSAAKTGGLLTGDVYRSGNNPDMVYTVSDTAAAVLTASMVLVSDVNSNIAASSITSTTLGYLDATSSVQTQINTKAPTASPTFTGTVSGITKTMVSLGSADNTADTAKPVSTAQQTALDLKSPLASPTFTGTPAAPTATAGTNTTQLATTSFVATAMSGRLPVITDGTIDANSTALQDNTLYLSSNTQALTNGATGAWAWALLNIRVGAWTRIQYLFLGTGIRYRTVDGTFTGATWN